MLRTTFMLRLNFNPNNPITGLTRPTNMKCSTYFNVIRKATLKWSFYGIISCFRLPGLIRLIRERGQSVSNALSTEGFNMVTFKITWKWKNYEWEKKLKTGKSLRLSISSFPSNINDYLLLWNILGIGTASPLYRDWRN